MTKASCVRVGAVTLRITKEQKESLVYYDRLFELCERVLPDCRCEVVLLPERAEVRPEERQALDGAVGRRFVELAAGCGAYLIVPMSEADDGRLYNTQVVISPAGERVHAYRKVHLAPGEDKKATAGERFETFELPWFRAGLMICYDHHFPESARCLAVLGAEVLFWPAYGDPLSRSRNAARCVDNNVYLIGAGVVDMACDLPAEVFSRGLIMDPGGGVLAEAEPVDGLISAELPLDAQTGRLAAWAAEHDYLSRRMPGSYGPLVG